MSDQWNAWPDAWPDWLDSGRRIEILLKNGRTIDGELRVDEAVPDGEGDEYPSWVVELDDDGLIWFASEIEKWRFVTSSQ